MSYRGRGRGGGGRGGGAPVNGQHDQSAAAAGGGGRGGHRTSRGGRGSQRGAPSTPYGRGGADGGAPRRGAFAGSGSGFELSNHHQRSGTAFEVTYAADCTYADLNEFINSKTYQGFRYIKLTLNPHKPGTATLIVNNNDVKEVAKLNGQLLRNQPVTFTQSQGGGRQLTQQQRAQIKQVIQQRYDQASHALNLSNLQQVYNTADFDNRNFCTEIVHTIQELYPDVQTLDLSDNRINTQLGTFSKLGYLLPQLKNLALANNNISTLEVVETLGSGQLSDHVQALILSGNPLQQNVLQQYGLQSSDPTLFHNLISAIFPNLRTLDNQPVQNVVQFDIPVLQNQLPGPSPEGFFDNDTSKQLVTAFVGKFFELYDASAADRQKLIPVYSENAEFSLTVATEVTSTTGSTFATTPPEYTAIARNYLAMGASTFTPPAAATSPAAATTKQQVTSHSLLKQGPVTIVYALTTLPATRHDLGSINADVCTLPTSPNLPQSMIAQIKGIFLENDTAIRSFHRTFVLGSPTAEGHAKGWTVSILHDMLFIGGSKPYQNPQLVQQQQQVAAGQNANDLGSAEAFFTM